MSLILQRYHLSPAYTYIQHSIKRIERTSDLSGLLCCIADAIQSLADLREAAKKRASQLGERCDLSEIIPPAVFISSICPFLSMYDLNSLQITCKKWNQILSSSQANNAWKQNYLSCWSKFSSEHKKVATSGPSTPWKTRLSIRVSLESNWLKGRHQSLSFDTGFGTKVSSLHFNQSDEIAAASHFAVKLWNFNGDFVKNIHPQLDYIQDLKYFNDAKLFIGGGKRSHLIDLKSNTVDVTFEHTSDLRALTVLGNYLITASKDGKIKIWDSHGGCVRTIADHKGEVFSVCGVGSSKDLFLSASADDTLRLYDVRKEDFQRTFKVSASQLTANNTLAISSIGQTISVWHLAMGKLQNQWGNGGSFITRLYANDRRIIFGSGEFVNHCIKISSHDGRAIKSLVSTDGSMTSLACDSDRVVAGFVQGIVRTYDFLSGRAKKARKRGADSVSPSDS